MRRHLILSVALLINTSLGPSAVLSAPHFTFSQSTGQKASGFDSTYKLRFRNAVQDKNFYLLSLFQRHSEVGRLLKRNAVLRKLSNDKALALRKAANCNQMDCFDQALRFTGPTIETVAIQLEALSKRPEFKKLVMNDMRPSGAFIKYSRQSDAEMLVAAWRDAANGMNRLLPCTLWPAPE